MYKFLTRILGLVASTIYYATVSAEKQIKTYIEHGKDIDIIRNLIVWIISAMLCVHFTNNWMYVLFESKCEEKELWNIYEFFNTDPITDDNGDDIPTDHSDIKKLLYNFIRYELWIIYYILEGIEYIPNGLTLIKDQIHDKLNVFTKTPKYYGNIIYYTTFFIVYIISVICTKYSIKWFSDFVQSFLSMTFFKNWGIMTTYGVISVAFCVHFYHNSPIPSNLMTASFIGWTAATIVAFILLYALQVAIGVPVGFVFSAIWLLIISMGGRYMCVDVVPKPDCPVIPTDGDIPNTEITYHLIKAVYDNALNVVILLILFVSLRDFNLNLSTELSVIPDVSIKGVYITFICLLILAFGSMFYSRIRLVVHNWYAETENKVVASTI